MINPDTVQSIMQKHRAKKSQRVGSDAQAIIVHRLRAFGMRLVEQVATPSMLLRRGGKIVGQAFTQKVSGDIRAVMPPNGVSVLCEVKFRPDLLALSDFKEHQRRALCEHWMAGGLSLVAWMNTHGLAIMEYHVLCDQLSDGHPIPFNFTPNLIWRAP